MYGATQYLRDSVSYLPLASNGAHRHVSNADPGSTKSGSPLDTGPMTVVRSFVGRMSADSNARHVLLRFSRQWLLPRWRQFLLSMLIGLALAASTAGYPKIIKESFNSIGKGEMALLPWILTGIISVTALRGLCLFLHQIVSNRTIFRLGTDLQTRVIAGAANPHLDELRRAAQRFGDRVEILASVTDMPAQMAWANCAVSAAGGTCWELLFMGLPAALLTVIDNQRGIASALAAAGAAIDLGWHTDVDSRRIAEELRDLLTAPERLAAMSARGRELVDGEGAARVVMRLEGSRVRVRRVREQDCELLWHWANDPEVRARAFSTTPIPRTDHVAWFGTKIASADCLLLIGIDVEDLPIGQVRFDSDAEGIAKIDISIDRSRRVEGFGLELLRAALRVASDLGIRTARALVKPDNAPSLHLFAAAGFENVGGRDAVEFRLALPTSDPAP